MIGLRPNGAAAPHPARAQDTATQGDSRVRDYFWPGLVAPVQPLCNPLQPDACGEAVERAQISATELTDMTRQ